MQQVRLRWNDPKAGSQERIIEQGPVTIGSAPNNEIVLQDTNVSDQHAVVDRVGDQVVIRDLQSRTGVRVNGQRVQRAILLDGATIQIGSATITVSSKHTGNGRAKQDALLRAQQIVDDATVVVQRAPSDATVISSPSRNDGNALPTRGTYDATIIDAQRYDATVIIRRVQEDPMMAVSPIMETPPMPQIHVPATPQEDWPPAIFSQQLVPVKALEKIGVPVSTVEYATVGAGLGSFIWADLLCISGVQPESITALGLDPRPYAHYKLLTRNSQIPEHERLRSNSESTPDNIWGWPGYAAREIWGDFRRGNIGRAWGTFWQIFGEPTITDTYTPRIGDVFKSIDRETKRIGWDNIMRYGRVRAIRKTDDGRYVIAYSGRSSDKGNDTPVHSLLVARYVHLATGYPAIQFLPDLQRYRAETGDFLSVVNAYEDHDHIYEHLRRHGGLVMIRGRGIVASRILQRIAEERAHNPNIGIIHLLRSPTPEGQKYGKSQREVINHFEFQPFNWPRGCWTGPQRKQLERADPETRKRLLESWGGTTTAKRKDWVEIGEKGLREGWYQIAFGTVERVERNAKGELVTVVRAKGQVGGELRYTTDFIIDATGLDAKVKVNPLLRDMVEHYSLALNPLDRLQVENDFEVTGMRNNTGRIYAAGAMTLGGPNAGVDTFLGLQYAAIRSVDALRSARAPGVRSLNGLRSVAQWIKWATGVKP